MDPSEICAFEFKNGISPIRKLVGFSDYRHQSVDFSTSTTPAQHSLNGKKYRQPIMR
ncbi:MAG: hypothetical protein JSR55_06860 [Proteobacteria bacterium]|nr:hypothetical protein [Pseudomonadota bacterium]